MGGLGVRLCRGPKRSDVQVKERHSEPIRLRKGSLDNCTTFGCRTCPFEVLDRPARDEAPASFPTRANAPR